MAPIIQSNWCGLEWAWPHIHPHPPPFPPVFGTGQWIWPRVGVASSSPAPFLSLLTFPIQWAWPRVGVPCRSPAPSLLPLAAPRGRSAAIGPFRIHSSPYENHVTTPPHPNAPPPHPPQTPIAELSGRPLPHRERAGLRRGRSQEEEVGEGGEERGPEGGEGRSRGVRRGGAPNRGGRPPA